MTKVKKTAENKAQEKFGNERAVFDKLVPIQRGDIFKVMSQGVNIEFTDRFDSAQKVYKDALKPKEMFKIARAGGAVTVVARDIV